MCSEMKHCYSDDLTFALFLFSEVKMMGYTWSQIRDQVDVRVPFTYFAFYPVVVVVQCGKF